MRLTMQFSKPNIAVALSGCVWLYVMSALPGFALAQRPHAALSEDAQPSALSSANRATPSSEPAPAIEKPAPLTVPFTTAQAGDAQAAWAKSLGREVVEKNSIGMEFVLIPPGEFRMGSPRGESGREDDEEQVDVTLSKPFCMGKTEVTQGQWRAVMDTTPWKGTEYGRDGENCAATHVSW